MKSLPLSVLLGVVASLAACRAGGDAPRSYDIERATTSPEIAVANLNSQITAAAKRVEIFPKDVSAREQLVALLMSRTQFLGSYDDFDLAFATVEDALARELDPGRCALLHAQILSAVHRFDEASAELDRAESLGAEVETTRQTIALARGEDAAPIIALRAERAERLPSYTSLTRLSAALTAGSLYEEADGTFHQALESYRDVSPFPVAWIAFQRGVIWGERANDPERAYALYEVAVSRLPQYVVGNVHLSELEVARGELDSAIERLSAIVDTTKDPEPASRLAQYLADSDPQRASAYAEQARAGYEELLERYPLAFADHATEFYLGAGDDASRALELALRNLDNRKTERAYGLAIRAARASGDAQLACALTQEAELVDESC